MRSPSITTTIPSAEAGSGCPASTHEARAQVPCILCSSSWTTSGLGKGAGAKARDRLAVTTSGAYLRIGDLLDEGRSTQLRLHVLVVVAHGQIRQRVGFRQANRLDQVVRAA